MRTAVDAPVLPGGLGVVLAAGRVPWDELAAFPEQTPEDRAVGDAAVKTTREAFDGILDGDLVEQERVLPAQFYSAAHRAGLLRLQVAASEGGYGLSDYNTFRVVSALTEMSTAAGLSLAVHNGIGVAALLPALRPGELRSLVLRRLAEGVVSGWADTEPQGAANLLPRTVAEPAADGGFRLTGGKVFTANGPVAGELIVSATVPARAGTPAQARLFLVDTRSAGFRVRAVQEMVGLRGVPLGTLELRGVEVPRIRVIDGAAGHWRDTRLLEAASSRGRAYLVAGSALAISRRCVAAQREFARRRTVDGQSLATYPPITKLIAHSLADLYALDTLTRWGLIGDDALAHRHADRNLAKNLCTAAAWRVVDRTMSLFAAEGAETARSKLRRGAPPVPVEQLLRDARVLRVTGGIDFFLDPVYGSRLIESAAPGCSGGSPQAVVDRRLVPVNAEHLATVCALAHRLAGALATSPATADKVPVMAVGRITAELLAMTLTLARAAGEPPARQHLAGVYCADALRRIAPLWCDLDGEPEPEDEGLRATAEAWLG